MSKIYKSTHVKIDEPRKLENIFPARFPTVGKKSEAPFGSDAELVSSFEDETNVSEDFENTSPESIDVQEANLEAERIIDEAKELYKNIVSEANREANEMTSKANDEVEALYQRTYEEAYESAILEAKRQIGSRIEEAQEIKDFLDHRRAVQLFELEADIVKLVLDISHKVIGTEIQTNEAAILALMKNALSRGSFTEKASLRVATEDFPVVNENRILILRSVEGLSELEVIEDISLNPGSCVVDTPSGEINASVEVQLKELEKVFNFILRNDL